MINIRRFVNLGLLEGVREMALCCDRQQGGRDIRQGGIHKVISKKVIACFPCIYRHSIIRDLLP